MLVNPPPLGVSEERQSDRPRAAGQIRLATGSAGAGRSDRFWGLRGSSLAVPGAVWLMGAPPWLHEVFESADSSPDLAVANAGSNTVRVLLNTGTGTLVQR